VPNSELMVCKLVALTRLMCPAANIPSTSALATINKRNGRELGLQRGANVVMPNLTPLHYRKLYEIYPAKACIDETGEACNGCLRRRIASIGRNVGRGPGGRGSQQLDEGFAPAALESLFPRPTTEAAVAPGPDRREEMWGFRVRPQPAISSEFP
jgi:hypothetical protein